MAAEVDGCGNAMYLVGQYGQLYSLYTGTGGPETSAVVTAVAERETVSVPEERFVLQCSAHAAAYEYYWLELDPRNTALQ